MKSKTAHPKTKSPQSAAFYLRQNFAEIYLKM